MGVRDAVLRIVRELNRTDEEILVYGPLIHNPQTTAILETRGLRTVNDLEGIEGKTIAIRTHGITADKLREIKGRSTRYYNLTCPKVSRVQGIIRKYSGNGYYTIIVGDHDHAEVLGLKSYARAGVTVVSSASEIGAIPEAKNYLVVSQTTQDADRFDEIVTGIRARRPDITVFNTICESTHNRQADVTEGVKAGADALVVVGGRKSANTQRLAQMGHEYGIRTFHVETEDELSHEDFRGVRKVLVTAGASTPGWIINNVMERLYDIRFRNSFILVHLFIKLLQFVLRTSIFSAVAAYFITAFAQSNAGYAPDRRLCLVSMLYIFSMYTVNNFLEMQWLLVRNPVKYALLKRFRFLLIPLAAAALGACGLILARYQPWIMAAYGFSALMGTVYSTGLIKKAVQWIPFRLARLAYSEKNIISSVGWTIAAVLLPLLSRGAAGDGMLVLNAYVFSMILMRYLLLDIIASQGDLILGRQTLPATIGPHRTKVIGLVVMAAASIPYAAFTMTRGAPIDLVFLAGLAYMGCLFVHIPSRSYFFALKYEFLVDFNFVLFIALCLLKGIY
mgnify:CR=1 FL=1